MAADLTVLTVVGNHITNLVVSNDVTVINTVNDITVFNATSATISLPNFMLLSNFPASDISSEAGSAGISNLVSRSDHVHSAANVVLNGGNF